MEVLLGGIIPTSTVDYPGKSAAVVFLGTCNFRCPYCYNWKMLEESGCRKADDGEVYDKVMEERELISGVVFSGGEPTLQDKALFELAWNFKQEGLSIKLDTNGSNYKVIAEMLSRGILDYVALDIKAPMEVPREYARAAGISTKHAEDTIHSIWEIFQLHNIYKFTLECRTTIVNPIVHHPHQIEQIAAEIKGHTNIYTLQQFTSEKGVLSDELEKNAPPTREELLELAQHAKNILKKEKVWIRTSEGQEEL